MGTSQLHSHTYSHTTFFFNSYYIFSISVFYIKEELDCDAVAVDIQPAVNPSDIRGNGAVKYYCFIFFWLWLNES